MDHSFSSPNHHAQTSEKQPDNKFNALFFNPTAKLAALRISLLGSAALLGSAGTIVDWHNGLDVTVMATLVVVFLHHLGSAFKIRFIVRLLDLILIIAEITLLTTFVHNFSPSHFDPPSVIVIFVSSWSLVVTLSFLLICRLAAIIRYRGKNLFKTFNFLEDAQRMKGIPIENCPAAYSILIGRSIWRIQFVGESLTVRLIRGFMAGIFITALIGYGVLSFIVKPVQETALTPIKESRGNGVLYIDLIRFGFDSWDFDFTLPALNSTNLIATGLAPEDLYGQVIKVTPLNDPAWGPDRVAPNCTYTADVVALDSIGTMPFLHVNCPFPWPGPGGPPPDVLIEVDYAPIFTLAPTNTLNANMWTNTITVGIGFSNKTQDVLSSNPKSKSADIILVPNSHSLGEVSYELRKVFRRPALSALGMFEGTDVFATAQVQNIIPDPLASVNPPVFNMSGNSSTFRLFYTQKKFEIRVIEDSRQQSVLGGFSAVGGLWTFLGGVFTVLFGTNLVKIFFDAKPLSIFGLAQQFEKTKIVSAHLEKYPNIKQEVAVPEPQRGIMSLLQDYLIDIDLFREAVKHGPGTSGPAKDSELEKPTLVFHPSDLETGSSSANTPGIEEVAAPTLVYRK